MKTYGECVSEGKIRKSVESKKWVGREIDSAKQRIKSAERVLKIKEYELSLLSAYNAILNLNRALVFNNGLIVKGHLCLIKTVQKLFVNNKEINELGRSFERALESRNLVQYEGYSVNEDQAEFMLDLAKDYLVEVEKLIGGN
jgi:uncharacterized protein (UPF0332 family)